MPQQQVVDHGSGLGGQAIQARKLRQEDVNEKVGAQHQHVGDGQQLAAQAAGFVRLARADGLPDDGQHGQTDSTARQRGNTGERPCGGIGRQRHCAQRGVELLDQQLAQTEQRAFDACGHTDTQHLAGQAAAIRQRYGAGVVQHAAVDHQHAEQQTHHPAGERRCQRCTACTQPHNADEPEVARHIDEVDDQTGDHRDHAVALAAVERGNSAVHRQKRVAEPYDAEVVAGTLHDVRLHIAKDQPQGRGTQQLNTC